MNLCDALKSNAINFNKCVLVDELAEKYKIRYEDAHVILYTFLRFQNKMTKYELRFLVQGFDAATNAPYNEILHDSVALSRMAALHKGTMMLHSAQLRASIYDTDEQGQSSVRPMSVVTRSPTVSGTAMLKRRERQPELRSGEKSAAALASNNSSKSAITKRRNTLRSAARPDVSNTDENVLTTRAPTRPLKHNTSVANDKPKCARNDGKNEVVKPPMQPLISKRRNTLRHATRTKIAEEHENIVAQEAKNTKDVAPVRISKRRQSLRICNRLNEEAKRTASEQQQQQQPHAKRYKHC